MGRPPGNGSKSPRLLSCQCPRFPFIFSPKKPLKVALLGAQKWFNGDQILSTGYQSSCCQKMGCSWNPSIIWGNKEHLSFKNCQIVTERLIFCLSSNRMIRSGELEPPRKENPFGQRPRKADDNKGMQPLRRLCPFHLKAATLAKVGRSSSGRILEGKNLRWWSPVRNER